MLRRMFYSGTPVHMRRTCAHAAHLCTCGTPVHMRRTCAHAAHLCTCGAPVHMRVMGGRHVVQDALQRRACQVVRTRCWGEHRRPQIQVWYMAQGKASTIRATERAGLRKGASVHTCKGDVTEATSCVAPPHSTLRAGAACSRSSARSLGRAQERAGTRVCSTDATKLRAQLVAPLQGGWHGFP
eukprot:365142-Chlamydomonas_euryale.AAC.7